MKIALIHYRILRRGGLETRLINYANFLAAAGHDVTIVCAKKTDEVTFSDAIKIVKLSRGIVPKVLQLLYFNRQLRRFFQQNHFDFRLSLGRTFYQDAVLAPNNHAGFLEAMGKKGNRLTDKIQHYLDKRSFEDTKIVFAASQMMKDEAVKYYGIDAAKIRVLYPPLNAQNFAPPTDEERAALRKKFDIPENTRVFAFVSASHKRKGLEVLSQAFELLEDADVLLLIAGYEKVTNLSKNVRSLGFLNEPRTLYALADFTLHPAKYEPFGQIISESLSCGTPVIVSHKVGAKEIVSPDVGLVLNTFDPKIWADTLRHLDRKNFNVPTDFIQKNKLSLEQHMEKLVKGRE
jgi:glycosyltransferase involved in cell wall biosynthesis